MWEGFSFLPSRPGRFFLSFPLVVVWELRVLLSFVVIVHALVWFSECFEILEDIVCILLETTAVPVEGTISLILFIAEDTVHFILLPLVLKCLIALIPDNLKRAHLSHLRLVTSCGVC